MFQKLYSGADATTDASPEETTRTERRDLDPLISAIIDNVMARDDDNEDLRYTLIDASEDDVYAKRVRREILAAIASIAETFNFKKKSRAKTTAVWEALWAYVELFRSEDKTDLTSNDQLFGAMTERFRDINHDDTSDWLETHKDAFQGSLNIAFDEVRRQARAGIADAIAKVYEPLEPRAETPTETTPGANTTRRETDRYALVAKDPLCRGDIFSFVVFGRAASDEMEAVPTDNANDSDGLSVQVRYYIYNRDRRCFERFHGFSQDGVLRDDEADAGAAADYLIGKTALDGYLRLARAIARFVASGRHQRQRRE